MNIAQLSEQLKDVPQNRLIDYARNPNSVVPQFLALAEIQRRQQLQAQAQPPSATVAEDVLSQATAPQMNPMMAGMQQPQQMPQEMPQQLPENQPGVAQLPTGMGQGFAPGGLVAFSGTEGSLVSEDDEAYQDYLDKKESAKRRSALSEMFSGLKDRVAGVGDEMVSSAKSGIQQLTSSLPQSYEDAKKQSSSTAPHDVNAEEFLAKLEHLESRGKDYDKKGRLLTSLKGAEGRMQVMPKTQLKPGYGVEPARDDSPEEKARVGRDYGLAMLREFKDPQVAAMAYNWGPANVKKWLASDRTLPVPKETREYRSHFAQGGIAHFYAGGNQNLGLSPGESVITPITMSDLNSSYEDEDKYRSLEPKPTEPPKPVNPFIEYMNAIRESEDESKAQAQQDKYMGILQAGLGMMSGSSPYAMQNIGAGGIQGLNAYNAAQKARAAEVNAMRKLRLGALEAQHLYDYRQEQLKSLDENRKERLRLAEDKLASAEDIARDKIDQRRLELTNNALTKAASNPEYKALVKERDMLPEDDPKRDIIEQRMEAIKESFIQTALTGKYVAPVFPKVPPKVEEPGFWSKIGSGLSKIYGSASSPQVTQEQQALLDKYK